MSAKAIKALFQEVKDNEEYIEQEWVNWMAETGRLVVKKLGEKVGLFAYPKTHNQYEAYIDLRSEFPGVKDFSTWVASYDGGSGLLAIGPAAKDQDRRNHMDLVPFLFKGKRRA